jgi:hypothetical protein
MMFFMIAGFALVTYDFRYRETLYGTCVFSGGA